MKYSLRCLQVFQRILPLDEIVAYNFQFVQKIFDSYDYDMNDPNIIFGSILVTLLLFHPQPIQAETKPPIEKMNSQASDFIHILDQSQKALLFIDFDVGERQNWSYIPRSRRGLPLKLLNSQQREMALSLLKSGLSSTGFKKAQQIMLLETVLAEIEGSSYRDPDLYFLSIFGTPSLKSNWGWRFEGHHISLNYTLVDGKQLAVVPSFWGANPARVPFGKHQGLRPLGNEEDKARAFLESLTVEQKKSAIVSERTPHEIFTGTNQSINPFAPEGIGFSRLNMEQQQLLMDLVNIYLGNFPPAVQQERKRQIENSGLETLHFSWHGGTGRGQKHYYRIQGSTFIIEYDNYQNDANHIHTVWREFDGDFGRDLLGEHLATHDHK